MQLIVKLQGLTLTGRQALSLLAILIADILAAWWIQPSLQFSAIAAGLFFAPALTYAMVQQLYSLVRGELPGTHNLNVGFLCGVVLLTLGSIIRLLL